MDIFETWLILARRRDRWAMTILMSNLQMLRDSSVQSGLASRCLLNWPSKPKPGLVQPGLSL